ncbi:MAG: hypothetical protein U0Q10_05380 [Dermatophilaceae bacterium]
MERLEDRGARGLVVGLGRPPIGGRRGAPARRGADDPGRERSWAHVIQVLREALGRAATERPRTVADDLFALAVRRPAWSRQR